MFGGDIVEDAACLSIYQCFGNSTEHCSERNSMMECFGDDDHEYPGNKDDCVDGYSGCKCDRGSQYTCHETYTCYWHFTLDVWWSGVPDRVVKAPTYCDSCF